MTIKASLKRIVGWFFFFNCSLTVHQVLPVVGLDQPSLNPRARITNSQNYHDDLPKIPVLFESDRILIVNKPFGISHHNDDGIHGNPGILQLLRDQRKQQQVQNPQQNEKDERLWGVHRLDKVTSGILVLAKDQEMASLLSQGFAQGNIRKIYFGVSAKKPKKKKQGWVIGEMVRSRRETWMLTPNTKDKSNSTKNKKSNFAKTRFFTSSISTDLTVLDGDQGPLPLDRKQKYAPRTVIMFVPYTGKTHQIRVAAKSMGIALMGDPLYESGQTALFGKSKGKGSGETSLPARTMLHASAIHIPSNVTKGDPITVWCEPPFFDFEKDNDKNCSSWYSLKHGLQSAVDRLLTKHCEINGLLEATPP